MVTVEEEMTMAARATVERAVRLPRPPQFVLGGVPIHRISMEYAAILVAEALLMRGEFPPLTIVGPNAQLVTLAQENKRFAAAMQAADLSVPDGISVVLASRLLQSPIPERVTGGDLMERMCAEAARYGFSVFFLGGLPGAAIMAARNLQERYPGLNICGTCCPPMGFENNPRELARIREKINAAEPDLLCVAFGAPKQEIWMQENRDQVRVGAILPVGAAFDTHAGLRRRAPRWIQWLGMEWGFRLAMEPRRLWRRYLIGNAKFVSLTLRQWLHETAAQTLRIARRAPVSEPGIPAESGD